MSWKLKFFLLVILSVPAFVGYPVTKFETEILDSVRLGWVLYFLALNSLILLVNGKRFYANTLAITALISLPVIFVGGAVSYMIFLLGLGYPAGAAAYSAHYVSLCITMLTVIPLALSLVAIIPFQTFEHNLLQHRQGVSKIEKFFLMFLRVFNHIVYCVIPNILETIREERQYMRWASSAPTASAEPPASLTLYSIRRKWIGLLRNMIQIGVEGICASIQYIPLWAVEISQLPDKRKDNGKS